MSVDGPASGRGGEFEVAIFTSPVFTTGWHGPVVQYIDPVQLTRSVETVLEVSHHFMEVEATGGNLAVRWLCYLLEVIYLACCGHERVRNLILMLYPTTSSVYEGVMEQDLKKNSEPTFGRVRVLQHV